jgi:hypothetical protein
MPRIVSLVIAAAIAIAAQASLPSPALACVSGLPTFEEVVHGAKAIARVTIVRFDPADRRARQTFRVERVLKGALARTVTVAPAWTSSCHDSVGLWAGGTGKTVVMAFDFPWFRDTLYPVWMPDPRLGSAGVPPGVDTLAEVESAILHELGLPNTATDPSRVTDRQVRWLLVIAAGFGALALGRRTRIARRR